MNSTSIESPIPGAWVEKSTGLAHQLVAVQQNECWYQTARSHNLFPMSIAEWSKKMRPADVSFLNTAQPIATELPVSDRSPLPGLDLCAGVPNEELYK